LRRYTQALAAFEEAIALDSHNQTLWKLKGQTLFTLWRFREVLKVARKMQELQEELAAERDS
jgi:tetratricopeptide (TPR) repeat protein